MKLGSLFSGGGLGDFGFMAAGIDIAWQCEIDEYCQKILALRYPESKKYRDINQLKGGELEPVDIVAGGFPCQPFSVAGNQRGDKDDRHLWPQMFRVIQEVKPRWIIGENVAGIIPIALDNVLNDLETQGYEITSFVFPAHACGASHRRDRLWIVGYSEHNGQITTKEQESSGKRKENTTRKKEARESTRSSIKYEAMANPNVLRCNARTNKQGEKFKEVRMDKFTVSSKTLAYPKSDPWRIVNRNGKTNGGYWFTEPSVGRVANGIANRVHRLKMLGNGQVPACTYVIGKMILEIENNLLNKS